MIHPRLQGGERHGNAEGEGCVPEESQWRGTQMPDGRNREAQMQYSHHQDSVLAPTMQTLYRVGQVVLLLFKALMGQNNTGLSPGEEEGGSSEPRAELSGASSKLLPASNIL